MEDLSGKSIGKYRIIRQIGHGGMAVVWLAQDNLNRYVAVKMIRSDAFSKIDYTRIQKRFMVEAQTVARLRHPNIVEVYAYGEYEGSPYLVMDYISGGTLRQFMGTKVPYQKAAALLAPIAHALAYAHKSGVLHRDIKPANILLTDSGEPVLGDFGIAKILEKEHSEGTLTEANTGVGTPEYMSPEQCRGDKTIDGRSDEYSLGIILYEMCTGVKPFSGKTSLEVMLKQIQEKLPKNWERNSGIPNHAARVIRKALEKEPDDRYADLAEFAEALDELSRDPLKNGSAAADEMSGEYDDTTRLSAEIPDTYAFRKPEGTSAGKKNRFLLYILIGAAAAAAILFGRRFLPSSQNTQAPALTQAPTDTDTPEPTVTNTTVPTATDTPVPTETNTPLPTATDTPEPTETNTPVPTATDTPEPTDTDTPVPTETDTPVPTATDTPKPTDTDTPVPTETNTPVPTATNTPEPTETNTPVPTETNTPVPAATDTPEAPAGGLLTGSEFLIRADTERKDNFKDPVMVETDGIEKYTTRARAQRNGRKSGVQLKPGDTVIYTGERYDLGEDIMLKVRTLTESEGFVYIGYLQPAGGEGEADLAELTKNDRIGLQSGTSGSAEAGSGITPTPTAVSSADLGHIWDPYHDPELKVGYTVEFGIFDDMPLKWFVLDISAEGTAILFSERNLKQGTYNEIAGIATTWENSDIRHRLNGEFLDEVFPPGSPQRSILRPQILENAYGYIDSEHPAGSTPDTEDLIYLLSVSEYTAYRSVINGCEKNTRAPQHVRSDYWLRSQGFDQARGVSVDPEINSFAAVNNRKGIRPVIAADTESLEAYFRTSIPSAAMNFGHLWDPAEDGDRILPGQTVELGTADGEKLRWIVLDDQYDSQPGRLLLLCENTIGEDRYNDAAVITTTWGTSDIRNRLNTEFLNKAFPESEPEYAMLAEVRTEAESEDRVFLLSEAEYRTYRTIIEDHDMYQADPGRAEDRFRSSEFWLRSTGTDSTRAVSTALNKQITDPAQRRITVIRDAVVTNRKGIRPAVAVDISAFLKLFE